MKDCNLYIILDRELAGDGDIFEIAHRAILGGARCFQLRDKVSRDGRLLKEARKLRALTRYLDCLFIINDRIDIALASDADGVHLGQDDMPYHQARKLVGHKKIIGISTHSLDQAIAAQAEGADYIGMGPVFETTTKPHARPIGLDIIEGVISQIRIPAFFIGGINMTNIGEIVKRGGSFAAVASAVITSADITTTTRLLLSTLRGIEKSENLSKIENRN